MSRDLRLIYAVASGLIAARIVSEAAYWIAHRFELPHTAAFIGGYGALLAGFAVGAAAAFRPLRLPKPTHFRRCGYNLKGLKQGPCPECGAVFAWSKQYRQYMKGRAGSRTENRPTAATTSRSSPPQDCSTAAPGCIFAVPGAISCTQFTLAADW